MGWQDLGRITNTPPADNPPPTPVPTGGPAPYVAAPTPAVGPVSYYKIPAPDSAPPGEHWWQYPNPPENQRFVNDVYDYGGISQAAQFDVNQLPFDIQPFPAGSPAIGQVSGGWGAGGWQIPSKIQVADTNNILAAIHEMAHVWFAGGPVDPDQFMAAINRFRSNPDPRYAEANWLLDYMDKAPILSYAKGNPNETYAYIAEMSGGDLNKIPDELRPFYKDFFTGNIQR